MPKYEYEKLTNDKSCHLYKIHINKKAEEDEKTAEDIRKCVLGNAQDKISEPFVCMWFEKGAERDRFDGMEAGSFIVYKETNGKHEAVHIGELLDSKTRSVKLECYQEETTYYKTVNWIYRLEWSEVRSSSELKSLYEDLQFQLTCPPVQNESECKNEIFRLLNKEALMLEKNTNIVENSKNVIFRGAPGTGKTYLAKRIAADIISGGKSDDITETENVPEDQWDFVQFHPSYDYADFVEGLRPHTVEVNDEKGNLLRKDISFELEPGIFKKFCDDAKEAYTKFKAANEGLFAEDKKAFEKEMPKYVFIIDEINRGEISKIFGELFYSVEPSYRGEDGKVSTQYSNMHRDGGKEKFYIPENVYIIGTMNDIDRSVDTFDFAMRRRFRFVEIKAGDTRDSILSCLNEDLRGEAAKCMNSLNDKIENTDGLGENYCIGGSYFSKLKELNGDFGELWNHYLEPLIEEYIRGMNGLKIADFRKVYDASQEEN